MAVDSSKQNKRPSPKEIQTMRDMRIEGESIEQIALAVGRSKSTVLKYVGDIDQSKEPITPGGPLTEKAVRKTVEKAITEKAVVDLEEVLEAGHFCVKEFKELAAAYGMSLKDFLGTTVEYWSRYYAYTEDLEAENRFHKALIQRLLVLLQPRVKTIMQQKALEKVLMTHLVAGRNIPDALLQEYLNKIWEEN